MKINRAILAAFIALGALAALEGRADPSDEKIKMANFTKMILDPKLPEPFSRSQGGIVMINQSQQDATLVFYMSDSEGIEITFPITSINKDTCNNTTTVATPPPGSTPYYKDFEIKVIDYSGNTCAEIKPEALTIATLKSYEVHYKTTTLSTMHAGALVENKN